FTPDAPGSSVTHTYSPSSSQVVAVQQIASTSPRITTMPHSVSASPGSRFSQIARTTRSRGCCAIDGRSSNSCWSCVMTARRALDERPGFVAPTLGADERHGMDLETARLVTDPPEADEADEPGEDRKSTRLNSS